MHSQFHIGEIGQKMKSYGGKYNKEFSEHWYAINNVHNK